MQYNRYDRLFDLLIKNEGSYSDHPQDTGGKTIYGITSRDYPDDYKKIFDAYKNKEYNKAKLLAKEFYKKKYWNELYEQIIDGSLAYKLFDLSVNVGKITAIKMLQKTINELGYKIDVDGVFGNKTLAAVNYFSNNKLSDELYKAYIERAKKYYKRLKTFAVFGRGWLNRLAKKYY